MCVCACPQNTAGLDKCAVHGKHISNPFSAFASRFRTKRFFILNTQVIRGAKVDRNKIRIYSSLSATQFFRSLSSLSALNSVVHSHHRTYKQPTTQFATFRLSSFLEHSFPVILWALTLCALVCVCARLQWKIRTNIFHVPARADRIKYT